MKYLIVGLGNIGPEYAFTRHNVGFMVLDRLAAQEGLSFKMERLAYHTEWKYKGRSVHLIKPTTYMNLSGKAVGYWMQQEKIPLENVLIISDELALPFGKLRLKPKGSAGGHNGLKNIEATVGANYARLRFGVGDAFNKGRQIDYVLGNFGEDEMAGLVERLDRSGEIIKTFCFQGLEKTMNFYNE
jgi:peptidyl-tRNA hydrolase, PTH1 family